MRVSSVSYFNNKYFQNSLGTQAVVDNDKVTPVQAKDKKSIDTTKYLLYGIGALAVLGIGYKFLKGKGSSSSVLKGAAESTKSSETSSVVRKIDYGKVVNETDDKLIEIETKPFKYMHDEPEDMSYEKLITITNKHTGASTTFQNFYRNGRLYEKNVSVDIPKDGYNLMTDTRLNYAYDENGNVEFVSRQVLGKTDNKGNYYNFDINNKTKSFEPFPIFIKAVNEKEAKLLKGVYTFEDLCEYNSAFDPLK